MDLRSHRYAYFDPSTLFVNIDPFSPSPRVRSFMFGEHEQLGTSYWVHAQEVLASLTPPEQEDFVLRLSAVFHERQHFHDVLLTPHGTRIVNAYFRLVVKLAALSIDLIRRWGGSGRKIPIPLRESDVSDPELLKRAYDSYAELTKRFEEARFSFEASAMITHRLAVLDTMGFAGDEVLRRSTLQSVEYGRLPRTLDLLLTRIADVEDGVNVSHLRSLLLAALSTDHPDATLAGYLPQLEQIGDRLERGARPEVSIARYLDEIRVDIGVNVTGPLLGDNLNFLLNELPSEMDALHLPKEVQRGILDAYVSFLSAASETRKLFQENATAFLDGAGLLDPPPGLVEPHVYWFLQPGHESFGVTLVDELPSDELWSAKRYQTGDRAILIPLLMPSDWVLGEHLLPKLLWVEVAKSFAGAIALLEPANFLHPLKGLWLRSIGPRIGVTFVRSRDSLPRTSRLA